MKDSDPGAAAARGLPESELTTAVRIALRACALVVVEEDPERRQALAEVGVRKIRAAIEQEEREAEARAALEVVVDRLGSVAQ